MSEVFTRLPADDPRSLVRAAAVCRSWRGILSDPGFARGYRAFHGGCDPRCCRVLDSRHGLVLLSSPAYDVPFDACDLVTNKWWEIEAAANPKCHDFYNGNGNGIHCNATVLCAIDRCDHLGCHGGPFLVALMGSADKVMNTEHAIGQYSSVFCL